MPRFDDQNEDYLELIKEYERYVIEHQGVIEDFDEWLELEYGQSRSKLSKQKRYTKFNKYGN